MAILGVAFSLLLLFAFQTTLLRTINIQGLHPDLVTITVVFLGYHMEKEKSVIAGGLLGLSQDALSGGMMGVNMLLKGLIGLGVAHLKECMVFENIITQSFLIIVATAAEHLLLFFLSAFLPVGVGEGFWRDAALVTFYNALIGPPGYLLLRKMTRSRGKRPAIRT